VKRVLVLGADGFIGRHIAFALRACGYDVLASARRPKRLARMGFDTLRADLNHSECADPAFWRPHLVGGVQVVNAAGLLSGRAVQMKKVHEDAPRAVYEAMDGGAGVLISAVGIDQAETQFAKTKRAGEGVAKAAGITILRPGLVMADTSYGGTSLARALSALPFITPLVGKGDQVFNPIQADDLAEAAAACLKKPPGVGPYDIGGPERVSQRDMLAAIRSWLGLSGARSLSVPIWLARVLGGVGDAMRLGPISRTAIAQMEAGVEAQEGAICQKLGLTPRGFHSFLAARPAGSQDLWHARLYLMRPALRLVLALMWLVSGLIGLTIPAFEFLPMIETTLPDQLLIAFARLGGIADLAIAAALLRGWQPRLIAGAQAAMVATYTLAFTLLAPALWLLPLGGLLKNLPILALIAVAAILEDER